MVGADRLSNSCLRCFLDLRPRVGLPPGRPKAPAAPPPRPRPPPPGRPPPPTGPPGRKPPPAATATGTTAVTTAGTGTGATATGAATVTATATATATGTTAVATATATATAAGTTGARAGTTGTRTTRASGPLARHRGRAGPRRHRSRARPRRHRSRARPGTAGTGGRRTLLLAALDAERVVAGATGRRTARPATRTGVGSTGPARSRGTRTGRHGAGARPGTRTGGAVGRGFPADVLALLLAGGLRGLDRGLLLGLQRGGTRLGGRHFDVVGTRRLGDRGRRRRRTGQRGLRLRPGHRRTPGRRRLCHDPGLTRGRGRGRRGRRSRGGRRRSRRRTRAARGDERAAQPPGDRRLDGARCGLHELAHFLQLGENGLAFDPELFCKLVYAGLACHCTPHSEVVRAAPAATSLVHLKPGHFWDFIVCSCRSSYLASDPRPVG